MNKARVCQEIERNLKGITFMGIAIAFAACSILEVSGLPPKTQCMDVEIPLMAEAPTPYICMFAGQVEIAKWANEHPNWIRKPGYECRPMGQVAKA